MPEIVQDDRGRIISSKLSSEEASRMAKKRWKKTDDDKAERTDTLLNEAGFVDADQAPEMMKILAETIVDGGARSVAAVGQFVRMLTPQDNKVTYVPGDTCPTCGSTPAMKWCNEALTIVENILRKSEDEQSPNIDSDAAMPAPGIEDSIEGPSLDLRGNGEG